MPADEVLLTLVVLLRLVVVPELLLLWGLPLSNVVELTWSILDVPHGTTIGIVSHSTTSEASITTSGSKGIVPNRCSSRGTLAILRKIGTLH
jgi:nucleoside recognition membrane protein YjiH